MLAMYILTSSFCHVILYDDDFQLPGNSGISILYMYNTQQDWYIYVNIMIISP